MRRLTALLFMFMSALGLSLLFTQQVFAVPETVTVKQAYLLDGENQTELTELQVAPGATFEPATDPGEGYEFAYYVVNGLISDKAEGEAFTVGSYLYLVAVYTPVDKFAVVFVDVNGEIIQHNNKLAQYVSSGEDAVAPTVLPTKKNYKVSETDPWSDSFNNVTENKVITLQYELDTDATFTISLNGVDQTANYNDIVTLTAGSDMLWKEDDQVVWYGSTYRFSALSDRTLTTEPGSAPTEPIVSMQEILDLRAGHRSYLAQVYAPNNDLLEVGFLRGSEHEVTFDNMSANFATALIPLTNEFIVSVPNSVEDNIRAYALSGDPLLSSYSYVEPIPQPEKLPAPVNGVNHTPSTHHVGVGEYTGGTGYSGQLRFVWFDKVTNEEVASDLMNAPANIGYAYIYTSFLATLPAGTYTVRFQAVGDGVLGLDSDFSIHTFEVTKLPPQLSKPALTLDENILSWAAVENATSYEVYINDNLVTSQSETSFIIDPVSLDLDFGNHTIKVVALADGYLDSQAEKMYTYIDTSVDKLSAPSLTIDENLMISWAPVANAIGYRITLSGQNINLESDTLEFDLNDLQLENGNYNIEVVAIADGVNYQNSDPSLESFTVNNALPRLNKLSVSDFVSSYLLNGVDGGHRKLEIYTGHAVFNQDGILTTNRIIRVGIKVDGEMMYKDFEFGSGAMVMIHKPGETTSFFGMNLPESGSVELHIILVSNNPLTHRDSEPLILTMNWQR